MSEFSIPQQGILIGDASRAPYDADEWSIDYTAKLLGFASRDNYGVILGYDNGVNFSLEVTPKAVANNQIEIKIGSAVVRGTLYVNDATETKTVQPNISGQARIDTVILRKDYVTQEIRAVILQGSPAASPVAPTLTQNVGLNVWEVPLANIAVANGFSAITESQITPRQHFVNVGDGVYIDHVLNDSGVTLNDGDVVVWKTGTVKAVTTTTTLNDWKVAGVWRGITANGGYGRLQIKGFGKVRVRVQNTAGIGSATLEVGVQLVTSATSTYSTLSTYKTSMALLVGGFQPAMAMNPIGTLMQSVSIFGGATFTGQLLAYIDVQYQLAPATAIVKSTGTGDAGTFTSGSWVTRGSMALTASNGFVSVTGANTIVLQPGTYRIRGYASGYRCDGHLARLQDTTNAATIAVSTPAYSPSAADSSQTFAEFDTYLTVEAATNYQLQQRCTTTRATDGLGKYVGFASESVTFALLEITRRYEVLP